MPYNNTTVDTTIISSPLQRKICFNSPYADCNVMLLYRGLIKVQIESDCWLMKPGDILILPAYKELAVDEYVGIESHALLIYVFNTSQENSLVQRNTISHSWYWNKPVMINSLFFHRKEVYRCLAIMLAEKEAKEYGWEQVEIGYFFIAMIMLLRQAKHSNSYSQTTLFNSERDMSEIAAVIYAAHPYKENLEELSQQFGMSRTTLERRFQNMIGMTPMEFINHVRVWEARDLILNTTHEISTIAKTVGYSDYRYFDRVFTRAMGIPPQRMRNDYRY